MPLRLLRAVALVSCVAAGLAVSTVATAQENCRNCGPGKFSNIGTIGGVGGVGATCLPNEASRPDLFYNFYARPSCGGVPAEMYPAPYPTPPLVGHTYYTYQPLMPHEFLYRHHRVYHQYYNYGRGLNRTTVRWW